MDTLRPSSPTTPQEHEPNPPNPPMVYVSEPVHWEYKRMSRSLKQSAPPTESELNEVGKEGWELISSITYAETLLLYFKRPIK